MSLNHEVSPETRHHPHRKSSKTKTTSAATTVVQSFDEDSLVLEAATLSSDKFFGMEPVVVAVNRSKERSLLMEPALEEAAEEDAEDTEAPLR